MDVNSSLEKVAAVVGCSDEGGWEEGEVRHVDDFAEVFLDARVGEKVAADGDLVNVTGGDDLL